LPEDIGHIDARHKTWEQLPHILSPRLFDTAHQMIVLNGAENSFQSCDHFTPLF
jgi:hypothetical protein